VFATTLMETEPSSRYFRHLVCLALFQDTEDALGDLFDKSSTVARKFIASSEKLARSVPRQPNSMSAYVRQSLQTEHFQVLNVVFASVFYDPLRELRLNALNLLPVFASMPQARNSNHAVSKACAKSFSALGPKARLRSFL
jgi:hypothetical protein